MLTDFLFMFDQLPVELINKKINGCIHVFRLRTCMQLRFGNQNRCFWAETQLAYANKYPPRTYTSRCTRYLATAPST